MTDVVRDESWTRVPWAISSITASGFWLSSTRTLGTARNSPERAKIGDPVKDYFPAVVSQAAFDDAMANLRKRFKPPFPPLEER
jgi:hypothetical protein